VAVAGTLTWVANEAVYWKYSVRDPDVWWHLKVGDWIVEHLAVPHNGIFSRVAIDRPWVAYSWGFEVVLSRVFQWFGLIGLGVFAVFLTVAVAYVQFYTLRRICGRFWEAWLLAACSLYTYLFVIMPRPIFISIMCYMVLLTALLEASRSGRVRSLYWLPAMFLVWANIHIQFIYGLFVLALFIACQCALRLAERTNVAPGVFTPASLPAKPLALIFVACIVATLIGPYGYHLYEVVFLYSRAKFAYRIIMELQALSFRVDTHFVQLILTAAGFIAVGWRKKLDPFKLMLMIVTSILAFRTARDCWFVSTTAAAFIADFPAPELKRVRGESLAECGGLIAVVAVFLLLMSQNFGFNERSLDHTVSVDFPVDAVNYLRRNPLPGPLYNDLNWGGFLIWYAPQFPVAIDGRNDLYGDALDQDFYEAQSGIAYKDNAYLLQSGCVLLTKKYPLATLLRYDPRFTLVYQDQISAVFARR
jgi:hypothetical protein